MTGERPERVSRDDLGSGAISGLWMPPGAPPVELVRAAEVRPGDVLYHGGKQMAVTDGPSGAWYVDDGGERTAGLAIVTAAGSAVWVLYRRGTEPLLRVLPS